MRRGRIRRSVLLAGCILLSGSLLAGCGRTEAPEAAEESGDGGKISVVTTIFPQYDFVRQIAGDKVELKMLLKLGEETHSYEPTPQDIIAIQNSDVFIYVGGENDAWVEDILESMPDSDMVTLKPILSMGSMSMCGPRRQMLPPSSERSGTSSWKRTRPMQGSMRRTLRLTGNSSMNWIRSSGMWWAAQGGTC